MANISAFVGHSFSDDDKSLGSAFAEFFDSVARVVPEFSWDHATIAAPIPPPEKVVQLLEGCQLFIGICSKRQGVLPVKVDQIFGRVIAPSSAIRWKTSDWILQEVGLAIGRRMHLIILVEEGVEPPGGLFLGEYIPFKRARPSESFAKFLDMVAFVVKPAEGRVPASAGQVTLPTKPEQDENTQTDGDGIEDRSAWSRVRYEFQAFRHILRNETDLVARVNEEFRVSSLNTDQAEWLSWTGYVELLKVKYSKDSNLNALKELVERNPGNKELKGYLAEGYAHYGEGEQAKAIFESIGDFASAAEQAAHQGNRDEAIDQLAEYLRGATGGDEEVKLRRIIDVATALEDNGLRIIAMERLSELRPDETSLRFQLGLVHDKYSEADLSLASYERIPESHRDDATWNNIGVGAQALNLKNASVAAYKKSAEMGNARAMVNLARLLQAAGFDDEAEAYLKQADGAGGDEGIAGMRASIISDAKEEAEKFETEMKGTEDRIAFLRRAGKAMTRPPVDLSGAWQSPDGLLTCTVKGSDVIAIGIRSVSKVVNALFGASFPSTETETISYKAVQVGSALHGTISQKRKGEIVTLLGGLFADRSFVAYASDTAEEVLIMERSGTTAAPKFYSLHRSTLEIPSAASPAV